MPVHIYPNLDGSLTIQVEASTRKMWKRKGHYRRAHRLHNNFIVDNPYWGEVGHYQRPVRGSRSTVNSQNSVYTKEADWRLSI